MKGRLTKKEKIYNLIIKKSWNPLPPASIPTLCTIERQQNDSKDTFMHGIACPEGPSLHCTNTFIRGSHQRHAVSSVSAKNKTTTKHKHVELKGQFPELVANPL